MTLSKTFFALSLALLIFSKQAYSQGNSTEIRDVNMDGSVEILAFGDSITRGVGDFVAAGEEIQFISGIPEGEAGYPLRIENLLSIPVSNKGFPGERLHFGGVYRFAKVAASSAADYVVISEGANDTFSKVSDGDIERDLQAMINISKFLGIEVILLTIPPACCRHAGLEEFILSYNQVYRNLADLNKTRLADSEAAFLQNCGQTKNCYLLNLPEGLHPNISGYDVIGEVVMSSLLNIDLLGPGGSSLLAQALDIPIESIETKSPAAPIPPVANTQ